MPTLNLTYQFRLAPKPSSPGRWLLYEEEACETCDRPVQKVNAVSISRSDAAKLIDLGVRVLAVPAPEQYYEDELDRCVCSREDCIS